MFFDSSLRKDLARNFVATVVVLLTIVMTIILIRTLGQASRGAINPSEVMLIMGFSMLSQLTTVLALSLFISVIATLSRMYSDSEMVIWLSGGQSLLAFVPVLLRFAWPVLVAIAFLAMVAWPWSNQQIQDLQDRYNQRNDVERVAPGRFQESSGGKRVFFIDKDSPDQNTGSNVFIHTHENGIETTTTARHARIEWHGNDRFLVLEQGEQWLRQVATGDIRWTHFDHYDLLIETSAQGTNAALASRQVPTLTLLQEPTAMHLGELSWRLGLGICALNFVLIAVPLSAVNPRRGRSYQYALAFLVFVLYYNLVNIGQTWIANGRYGIVPWMLTLHGCATAITLFWLWARHRQWTWRDVFVLPPRKAVTP